MSSNVLPEGWTRSSLPDGCDPYSILPAPAEDAPFRLIGLGPNDEEIYLYELPRTTQLAAVVEYFEVGSNNAFIRSVEEAEGVRKFSEFMTRVEKIVEVAPVFADRAGLKLVFPDGISDAQIDEISALVPMEDLFNLGLENYYEGGDQPSLERVKDEGHIHFWWD